MEYEIVEKKVVDLATLDTSKGAQEGRELELRHFETQKPLGVYLTLAGTDSEHWRNAVVEAFELYPNGENMNLRKRNIEIIARCTLGWRDVVLDGKPLTCTLDNARALYDRFNWIREQAEAFANSRANFLPA